MAFDYFMLVFIAAVGVYQIVSVPAGLRGLWFFRNNIVQYFFGVTAIFGSFSWFYTSEHRNVQHTVEGSQQLWLFLSSIIVAYYASAVLASIIQASVSSDEGEDIQEEQQDLGMETLKRTTLLGGILRSLRKRKGDVN
jgi:hypothetical protein